MGAAVSLGVVLFVPGYCLSLALYPRKEDLDRLERIVLSFGFGIAATSIMVFYANKLLGVPLTALTSLGFVALISAASLAVWYRRSNKTHGIRDWKA